MDRCTSLRVEAAVLLSEGKAAEARERIQEELATVKNAIYAATSCIEEKLLKELLVETQR